MGALNVREMNKEEKREEVRVVMKKRGGYFGVNRNEAER